MKSEIQGPPSRINGTILGVDPNPHIAMILGI
jgi:hypothetical protein